VVFEADAIEIDRIYPFQYELYSLRNSLECFTLFFPVFAYEKGLVPGPISQVCVLFLVRVSDPIN